MARILRQMGRSPDQRNPAQADDPQYGPAIGRNRMRLPPRTRQHPPLHPPRRTPDWITPGEAAFLTGVAAATIDELLESRRIRSKVLLKQEGRPTLVLIPTHDLVELGLMPQQAVRATTFAISSTGDRRSIVSNLAHAPSRPVWAAIILISLFVSLIAASPLDFISSTLNASLDASSSVARSPKLRSQELCREKGNSKSCEADSSKARPSPRPRPGPKPFTSPSPSSSPVPSPSPSPDPSPFPSPSPSPSPPPDPGWDGSAGPAGVTCPLGVPEVGPADSIQAALDRYGQGATICILGEHRLTSALLPKTGQILIGEGAILNGTKPVTDWARSGGSWMASGQTQSFPDPLPNGSPCDLNPMACQFEDLFRDDRPLIRVGSKDQLGPGKWYFDEAANQIFIADDPTGHQMEASAAAVGIAGNGADNVTADGRAHAGATKIIRSSDAVVRRNYSHDNRGDGCWFDWDNYRITIEANLFENNTRRGLSYEASFDAAIRNNSFRGNGWGSDPADRYGAGVFINTSKNLEFYENTFLGNRDALEAVSTDRGGSDRYGLRETANLFVHDNTFVLTREHYAVGIPFSKSRFPKSSRFNRNAYRVRDVNGKYWDWLSGPVAWTSWTGYGYDLQGALRIL